MDDAGAALGGVAADMGSCQAQLAPQQLDQQHAGLDLALTRRPFTSRLISGIHRLHTTTKKTIS